MYSNYSLVTKQLTWQEWLAWNKVGVQVFFFVLFFSNLLHSAMLTSKVSKSNWFVALNWHNSTWKFGYFGSVLNPRAQFSLQICQTWVTCWTPSPLIHITKTRLYNFDPLKLHFYIVKLGFIGIIIRTASASTHNLCFEQKYEKYLNFLSENFQFFGD